MRNRAYRWISEVDSHVAAEGIDHCPPDRILPSTRMQGIAVLAIVANQVLDIISEVEEDDPDD